MVYTLSFFLFKVQFSFHNSNVFGSCIIHILYIYSTNIDTEYFKHGIYSKFFFVFKMQFLFHNSNVFGSCIIHIYIFIQQIWLLNILNTVYTLRFFLQNSVCFIILTHLVPALFTFYVQNVLKLKQNSGAKRLNLLWAAA